MTSTILPRGIHITERPLANGGKSRFFRVKMNRQGLVVDQIFEDAELALAFLNENRRKLGLEPVAIQQVSQDEAVSKAFVKRMKNPSFEEYVEAYLNEYIIPKNKEYIDVVEHYKYLVKLEKMKFELQETRMTRREHFANLKKIKDSFPNIAEAKLKERHNRNIITFYKSICDKEVHYGTLGSLGISTKISMPTLGFQSKRFGDFLIKEIKPRTINNYIKIRAQEGIKASSIQREITFISNIFGKIHKLNEEYDSPLPNPALDYDKDLLSLAKKSKDSHFRFTEEMKRAFFNGVEKHENPEFRAIVKLMLFTAMRRSEVILLKWSQVKLKEEYIALSDAKGKARNVYLINEAVELLESLPRRDGQERVFPSYVSVIGFEGSFTKFVKEKKFFDDDGSEVDCSEITCHKLRKEAISTFVENIGASNSLLISEFLGLRAVKKLEENIREMPKRKGMLSQEDVLQSVGHISSNITKKYYFSFLKR